MRNTIGANRVAERRGYVRLARHLVEALRSPFARNDLIAQGGSWLHRHEASLEGRSDTANAGGSRGSGYGCWAYSAR